MTFISLPGGITLLVISFLLILPFIPAVMEWRYPQDAGALEPVPDETRAEEFAGIPLARKVLAVGTVFSRIQADCIRCGEGNFPHPGFPLLTTLLPWAPVSARWYPGQRFWRSQGNITVPPGIRVNGDLIADGNVILGAGSVINGSVKSGGHLQIHDLARIEGGGIAEDISLHHAAAVSGCLVARRRVRLGTLSQVGAPSCPGSVVATDITLYPGACVYGAVHAHHRARIVEMDKEHSQ
ncbi:polymer-forming cytoskeletal protein [Salmonella enterica]|nr:polymer-forming cytoskeletal protein [Salmonella enterica]